MTLSIFLFCAYLTITSSVDAVIQDFYWRDYTYGDIPRDAYQGAPGLYIGQVHTKERNTVANIYPSTGNAVTEYAGKIIIVEADIKIFCSGDPSKFYWEDVDLDKPQDRQLQDAVRGGYHNNTNDPLFIGKVMHQEEWKIGKVLTFKHENNKGIWVWNQRQQPINIHQFHILKYNTTAPVFVQNFYWRDYTPGVIPNDALEVDNTSYIAQIVHNGHFLPATIFAHSKIAIAEMDGVRIVTNNIKIMCTTEPSRFYWEHVDFTAPASDQQMKNAVKGGFQLGYDLYIGKEFHDGEVKIGKVIPFRKLLVWDKNKEIRLLTSFQILKYN